MDFPVFIKFVYYLLQELSYSVNKQLTLNRIFLLQFKEFKRTFCTLFINQQIKCRFLQRKNVRLHVSKVYIPPKRLVLCESVSACCQQ